MRHRSWWLWACAIAVYAFLYLPLSVVVAFSFNDSKLSAEWVGFTLDWYRKLFADDEMLAAAWNSLLIAVIASAVATVLGTMAGIAIHRYRMRVLLFMVLTPVAMPEILLGVSLLIFFISVFGADALSLATVVIAHITFCIGFVAIIVRARLADMDEAIFEAARDLGATPWQTFRLVTLPLIMPAVIAGALMAFTLSRKGLVVDLVIWNEEHVGYRQRLQDQIIGLIATGPEAHAVDRPGGIFVRYVEQISNEDRILLQAAARVIISESRGSLVEQANRRVLADKSVARMSPTRAHHPGRRPPDPATPGPRARQPLRRIHGRRNRIRDFDRANADDAAALGQRARKSGIRDGPVGKWRDLHMARERA